MSEATEEEIRKAREKISKLLNMTVENGCTEDEQGTAMKMAAGLATRLGIALDSVRAKDETAAERKATQKILREEFKFHQVLAAKAAAVLYGCKLFTYSNGKGGLYFIGREENVDLAEETMLWLMRQVELLYKENLPRGLSQSVRAEFRKTFKAACANRVYERAWFMMREMRRNDQAAQEATGQNALVVQGYFQQLDRENEAYGMPTAEQQARWARFAEEARLAEEARVAKLTPKEREAEEKAKARREKKEARQAARRKGRSGPRMPVGNGTESGVRAGDRVQLRKEIH